MLYLFILSSYFNLKKSWQKHSRKSRYIYNTCSKRFECFILIRNILWTKIVRLLYAISLVMLCLYFCIVPSFAHHKAVIMCSEFRWHLLQFKLTSPNGSMNLNSRTFAEWRPIYSNKNEIIMHIRLTEPD